jgi:hypothetical protein
MKSKQQIELQVEAALNSLDGAVSAIPTPFLLTRINAKLLAKDDSIWDKTLYFISRPAIAFAAVCIVIAVNIFVIANDDTANVSLTDDLQNVYMQDEEDVASNTLMIDNDNIEP